MSAIAALKGYRTQFLYSLYYILTNKKQPYNYRLEGEEDLDVLDGQGQILYAIQVKNLSEPITLSDIVSPKKTSFLKRFIEIYPKSIPILASFGAVSEDLKRWKAHANHKDAKEQHLFIKAGISESNIPCIKEKVEFIEVSEESITARVLEMLKEHKSIDPVPTAENLLYYIQFKAEKQELITARDLLETIDKMGIYLSERIAYTNQYGIYVKPLVKNELSQTETEILKGEFYYGVSTRYEHVYLGLDVVRDYFVKLIDNGLRKYNVIVIHGASGQGKSTLAYRYVSNKSSKTLIYEVNLQEDPVKTNEAIVAIATLTKGLKVPVFFVLHVTPNTTSWLRIAREFASHPFLRLLVTVRNEDWFRAQSTEIDFLYHGVELELVEDEAEIIFERLESRHLVKTHLDFKDIWMDLKPGVPLLEFTHAITQGSSLRDKLKGQVAQLSLEEATTRIGQLNLLRTVCLSDALGARIDVKRTKDYPNIKLIIDKFEKEYFIKHSADKKHLSGLHPIRSMLLVELLFDEFVVCKKEYIVSCLEMIDQEDAYPFILQVLYLGMVTVDELIKDLKSSGRNSWEFYGAATMALLWLGIREYIDDNVAVLDEVYEKSGDAWYIVTDIYHGGVLDLEGVLNSFPADNERLVDYFRSIRQRLSPKSDVYVPVVKLFNQMELPPAPNTFSEWRFFADTIFWLSQTENSSGEVDNVTVEDFRKAFLLLDTQSLALLMLGMHYYSDTFNQIRLTLAHIFNNKIRDEYYIPLLIIDDEVSVDFVVNISNDEQSRGWHNSTIEIIELFRTAYPEKTAFKSQGHGHRLDVISLPHDETTKHISVKNLPLAKWVDINANLRRLFDFSRRPEDWFEFHQKLLQWERHIKAVLVNFKNSFNSFRKLNSFTELIPVMEQMEYQSLSRLVAPKSAVDPLGIPVMTKRTKDQGNGKESKEVYILEKYRPFFESYNEYKSSIENFIRQSGKACYDAIKRRSDGDHALDKDNLRVSFINLYDATFQRVKFDEQRKKYFGKFCGSTPVVTDNDLFSVATTWNSFWSAIQANDIKRMELTERITGLKNDFINLLNKAIKSANKYGDYKIIYRNDSTTHDLPVFILEVGDPLQNIFALRDCYSLFYRCVKQAEYTSLKYMMLQRYFSKVYILSEIRGYVFDNKWLEFPLHLFLNTGFEELPPYRFVSTEIEAAIASNLRLKRLVTYPHVRLMQDLAADFVNLQSYMEHMADLRFFDGNRNLDEKGFTMVSQHVENVGELASDTWNRLLNNLAVLANEFPEGLTGIGSEEEQEYWALLLEIMKGLSLQSKEGQGKTFSMAALQKLTAKLTDLNEKWGLFMMLLQKKVLLIYEVPQ